MRLFVLGLLNKQKKARKRGRMKKRIEGGGFKPDEATARKIERFFGIELYAKEK